MQCLPLKHYTLLLMIVCAFLTLQTKLQPLLDPAGSMGGNGGCRPAGCSVLGRAY